MFGWRYPILAWLKRDDFSRRLRDLEEQITETQHAVIAAFREWSDRSDKIEQLKADPELAKLYEKQIASHDKERDEQGFRLVMADIRDELHRVKTTDTDINRWNYVKKIREIKNARSLNHQMRDWAFRKRDSLTWVDRAVPGP